MGYSASKSDRHHVKGGGGGFEKNVFTQRQSHELFAVSLPAIHQGEPSHSQIFACRNRAGRCRWSPGSFGDLPFPPPFHSGAAPYSTQSPSWRPQGDNLPAERNGVRVPGELKVQGELEIISTHSRTPSTSDYLPARAA
ncbi:hypothetical protein PR048_007948 [Dryococelus australis]|uniref:Uncharacterized protein n=1 Tax=Dryococelus australis TaxID=614101 RepID=A0ABQ9HXC8_9NEOP|nr:hypothetical protein PR048_007948 [Dryococelus australis]